MEALPGAQCFVARQVVCAALESSCARFVLAPGRADTRQLEKSLSSRDHAYWRFGTGNLDSLWTIPRQQGLDVRDELLKFHERFYSANVMKLVVLGKGARTIAGLR